MTKRRIIRGLGSGAVTVTLLEGATSAWAQCALCAKNAAAAGSDGIQGLQYGILLLLIPTLMMFVGVFWFAFRYRNPRETESALRPDEFHAAYEPSVTDSSI